LWIGITKFDIHPDHLSPLGRHRERPEANPFTFYERQHMIRRTLRARGIPDSDFGFLPFPIETPNHLPLFHPRHIRCYTTIREDWNREKIEVLKKEGYEVEVLWERGDKAIEGRLIREAIAAGSDRWRDMVPREVADCIIEWDIAGRLKRLSQVEGSVVADLSQT
jgi:nicotinamide mononucleotide adenylyltransferase